MHHLDLKGTLLGMAFVAALAVFGSLVVLAWGGCATQKIVSYDDIIRLDLGDHFLIVAPEDMVDRHCRKRMRETNATLDSGLPLMDGTRIAACVDYKRWKPTVIATKNEAHNLEGKPSLFISKRWSKCARHEACHRLKWGNPKYCDEKWPCLTEEPIP